MQLLSQAELAQFAAQDVAVIAGDLQAKLRGSWIMKSFNSEQIKNLAKLSISLQSVSLSQDKYEQQENRGQHNEDTVRQEMLLRWLEIACTHLKFPESLSAKQPSARFPTLNSLCAATNTQSSRSNTNIETLHKVEKSVLAFASAKMYNAPFFKFLGSFSAVENQATKHAERKLTVTNKTGLDEDESYPRHVYDALYGVVQKHGECCCELADRSVATTRRHWGRLELESKFRTAENEVIFHTVFSKRGLIDTVENVKWQHLQFRVPRKSRKARAMHFDIEKSDGGVKNWTTLDDAIGSKVKSTSDFCGLLGKDIGPAGMDVRISDEVLLVLQGAVYIEVDIADKRTISLADLLIEDLLVPRTKLLLAYILAKSVWQFYDSNFMNAWWTTESIQFFRERVGDDEDELDVDWTPYYAFSSDRIAEENSMERLPPGQLLHRYPLVLALGAILYELGRIRRPGKQKILISPLEPPTLEKKVNDIASKIRRLCKEPLLDIGLRDTQTLADYRMIVENCGSENFFRPNLQEDLQETPEELEDKLTVEERRAILFKKVVVPLKRMVQTAGWVDESDIIRSHVIKGSTAQWKEKLRVLEEPGAAVVLSDDAQASRTLTKSTHDTPTVPGAKAETWLREIKESRVMEVVFSTFKKKELAEKRIRIAVLDTGYDPDAVFFSRDRKRRLRGWKDYAEKDQPRAKDEDGHGTHVLSVLMKVAPAADIFVARVTRDTRGLQNATADIAQAIRWAWKDCNANIITMSFGFDEEIKVGNKPVISNAILEALLGTNSEIIFFAAAANDGGNRAEMFPARNTNVLSIRGTDDYGWAQRFNPPPDYNSATCFMTLGLDVPGASLSQSGDAGIDVCKSGTSVATPIAAGIAAILLGYARIHEEELLNQLGCQHREKLVKLWSRTGMCALFEDIATEMSKKWSYLNIREFANYPHSVIVSKIVAVIVNVRE
ncbi:hypothetical protein F5Y03DRAFT_405879 [Xylaria venustula]|nr:hypothetical protein F5Y03DRAFT_405879 [Xylaria venustula]